MEEYHSANIKRLDGNLSRFKVVKGNKGSNYSTTLDDFLARLNPGREQAGYKPYSHARLGGMIKKAGYKAGDLHNLYKTCNEARNFGSLFNYLMKKK